MAQKTVQSQKRVQSMATGVDEIAHYAANQTPELASICHQLQSEIENSLGQASAKIWHGSPVWFIGPNPVVGYSATASGIKLLFWSGQLFGEEALEPMGKDKAAQILYRSASQIDLDSLRRWLDKAATIIWDYAGMLAERRKQK